MTGEVVGRRYELKKKLGNGELGSTYLASDPVTGHDVTIKIVNSPRIEDPEVFSNFYDTFRSYLELNESGLCIVNARDSGLISSRDVDLTSPLTVPQVPFVVFDHFPGETLTRSIRKRAYPVKETVRSFLKALTALKGLHRKSFVHRALKPDNILINHDEELRLLHFGLHPLKSNTGQARPEAELSLPAAFYMSPEIAMGGQGDQRSDLYSMGIILYELLCGRVPYPAHDAREALMRHISAAPPSIRKMNSSVSKKLETLVFTLIEKDPSNRFPSCSEVIDALKKMEGIKEEGLPCRRDESGHHTKIALHVPLVRRRELERHIKSYLTASELGKRFIMLLKGPQGSGKKRIMEEAGAFARLIGLDFYHERCRKYVKPPYAPFVHFVKEYVASKGITVADIMGSDRVLPTILGERGFRAIETEDPNRPFLKEHQVLESFRSFFKGISTGNVVVLFLEDLQWIDESSMRLLAYLAEHRIEERLLIFATWADDAGQADPGFQEFREKLMSFPQVSEISVEPFAAAECEALLRNLTGADIIHNDYIERFARKGKGNPLYLIEAVKKLISDERIFFSEDMMLTDIDDIDRLPESLHELIVQRIINLPDAMRDLYKMASTFGRTFTFQILWEAMERPPEESFRELLERGRRLGIHCEVWQNRELHYMFTHDVIREAFKDLIPQQDRRERHALIGRILEEIYFDNQIPHLEKLVMHFSQARIDDKTINYLIKAADKSALMGATLRGIGFYEKALELIGGLQEKVQERWKCYRNLGILYLRMEDHESALEYERKALDVAEKKNDFSAVQECFFLLGDISMIIRDYKKALDYIRSGLSYETMKDTVWRCKLLSRMGKLSMLNNYKDRSFDDSLDDVKEALRVARDLRNVDATIEISGILAELYIDQNMVEEGEKALLKILNYRTDINTRIEFLERLGRLSVFPGSDYRKAYGYFKEALDKSQELNNTKKVAVFSGFIGEIYAILGDPEKALHYLKQALSLQKDNDGEDAAQTHSFLGDLYFYKGGFKKSKEHIAKARRILKGRELSPVYIETEIRLGDIELISGSPDQARAHYEKAKKASEESGFFKGTFFSILGNSEVYLSEGNIYQGRVCFVEASRKSNRGENRLGSGYMLMLQAIGHRLDGNRDTALTLLENAEDIFERIERPYELGRVNLEKARSFLLLDSMESRERAKAAFQKAKECFSKMENAFMMTGIQEESEKIREEKRRK